MQRAHLTGVSVLECSDCARRVLAGNLNYNKANHKSSLPISQSTTDMIYPSHRVHLTLDTHTNTCAINSNAIT